MTISVSKTLGAAAVVAVAISSSRSSTNWSELSVPAETSLNTLSDKLRVLRGSGYSITLSLPNVAEDQIPDTKHKIAESILATYKLPSGVELSALVQPINPENTAHQLISSLQRRARPDRVGGFSDCELRCLQLPTNQTATHLKQFLCDRQIIQSEALVCEFEAKGKPYVIILSANAYRAGVNQEQPSDEAVNAAKGHWEVDFRTLESTFKNLRISTEEQK